MDGRLRGFQNLCCDARNKHLSFSKKERKGIHEELGFGVALLLCFENLAILAFVLRLRASLVCVGSSSSFFVLLLDPPNSVSLLLYPHIHPRRCRRLLPLLPPRLERIQPFQNRLDEGAEIQLVCNGAG